MKAMTPKEVHKNLPMDDSQMQESFSWLRDYWQIRNDYIIKTREANEGLNDISFPKSTQYKAKVIHLGLLTSMHNEKVSRYLQSPTYQVIIEDPTEDKQVTKSSDLEKALNAASYEIERKSDGDVWARAISDCHLFDQGVYRIDATHGSSWREMVEAERAGKAYSGKARESYKKEKGIPFRRIYVPLENFLPQYDSDHLEYSFELEGRLLSSCLSNKLFDKEILRGFEQTSNASNMVVPLLHYCDDQYFATFATTPELFMAGSPPTVENINFSSMQFLYGYQHGLGRSIYNCMAGRFGGWKTSTNRIEGVSKIILGLNQAADEVASQVLTNIRAKYWPSLNFKVDPELRGVQPGGKAPDAPNIEEGGVLVTFKGEELVPIFQPQDDPTVPWMMDLIKDQLGKLGGSSVLYGQRQPGVDTGYHNAQQVSQAEHLDEKTEQHIVQGAIQDGTIMMLYARVLGEKLYPYYMEGEGSKKSGKYLCIDPKDLIPLPRLDARVRKPRPIDFTASLRAAREASDDRQGKGPLLSDLTILSELLGRESPDEESMLVKIQNQKNKLWNSGVIDEKIQVSLNLKLATNGVPTVGPETMSKVDPALSQAAGEQMQNPNAQAAGGIDPELANNLNMRSGGMMATDSQPEARVGEQVTVAGGGSL